MYLNIYEGEGSFFDIFSGNPCNVCPIVNHRFVRFHKFVKNHLKPWTTAFDHPSQVNMFISIYSNTFKSRSTTPTLTKPSVPLSQRTISQSTATRSVDSITLDVFTPTSDTNQSCFSKSQTLERKQEKLVRAALLFKRGNKNLGVWLEWIVYWVSRMLNSQSN